MKQQKFAAICLAGLVTFGGARVAYAQDNIRIYGAVDIGVAYTDSGAPGASRVLSASSGILRPSMLGFAGTEELGGGLQAIFQLEAGFDADTGAMKAYQGNPGAATAAAPGGPSFSGLFNRRAFVGLKGALGSLSLGRDYTPLYWGALATDVLGLTLYGNLQESVALSGTGSDRYGRVSNGLFYVTPESYGVVGRAMYSFGSESGGAPGTPPTRANRMLGASVTYARDGLVANLVYQQIELPTVASSPLTFTGATAPRKDVSIGVKYTLQRYALSAGYLHLRQPEALKADGKMAWLGATVPLRTGLLHASVQRLEQQSVAGPERKAIVLGLAYIRPLSKRTSLYASYGRVNNGAGAAFPLVSADPAVSPGAAGALVKALAVGIMHAF